MCVTLKSSKNTSKGCIVFIAKVPLLVRLDSCPSYMFCDKNLLPKYGGFKQFSILEQDGTDASLDFDGNRQDCKSRSRRISTSSLEALGSKVVDIVN